MRGEASALILALCGVAAVLGWLWGREVAEPPSETEVINRWAADYVAAAGEGAVITDCAATVSALEGVWLIIRCTPAKEGLAGRVYAVGPDGRLVDPADLEGPNT